MYINYGYILYGTYAMHCASTWNSGGVVVMGRVFNIVTVANVHSLLFSVRDIVSVHRFCVHTAEHYAHIVLYGKHVCI